MAKALSRSAERCFVHLPPQLLSAIKPESIQDFGGDAYGP
jgi:hypothetical protein